MLLEGFDEALLGYGATWDGNSQVDRLIYDGDKLIDIFVERDGMTVEEAIEFIDYNIIGAYVGPETPIVLWTDDVE